MAVARMKRVSVLFPRERRDEILASLQGAGVVQLETPEEVRLEEEPVAGPAGDMVERLAHALSYLDRFVPEKKGLLGSFVTLKQDLRPEEVEAFRRRLNAEEVCARVGRDDLRWGQIAVRLGELGQEEALLEPWRGLGVRLGDLDDMPATMVRAYVAAAEAFETIEEQAGELSLFLWKAPRSGRQVSFVAVWPRSEGLEEELTGRGARRVVFGDFAGEPEEELERLAGERRALEEERETLRERARSLEGLRPGLKALHDHYYVAAERAGLVLGRTEKVGLATGWVAAARAEGLRESLEGLGVAAVVEDPREGEEPPVALDNPRWLKPFEVVTTLYGYPRYNEVDPTPLLAPFFFVFFGVALADAGYGLALMGLAYMLIRQLRLRPGEDSLPRLLMLGGAAAVLFGAIGGSWFGDSLQLLPGWGPVVFARDVLAKLDPVTDPLTMLGISLGLGVLQVWTGIAIKLTLQVKAGQAADGIWEQGTWLLFLPSLVLMGVGGSLGLAEVAPKLAMVTGLGVALGAARKQRNWLLKPFSGLLGLYGVMGYLGDVLSYARLLALGLASTIIGIVVNQIAVLVGGIPLVGVVAGAGVMAGGHVFNLLISTLGSFVHAGRLQFVEFFTKFFEGGGKPFRPFRREGRYTVVRG
ncbi:MAG: V-type ATP synthase subunit I [bacterium]|nr:V-type ATP synthase subunit I [bacterium]